MTRIAVEFSLAPEVAGLQLFMLAGIPVPMASEGRWGVRGQPAV